ncbi:MAG: UdgX family uracil-DNA binding protein [Bryobacteraceae bacterium]|nr:UdgX family uracil-DNA binding protein [Bryobacteraceae bacterium]
MSVVESPKPSEQHFGRQEKRWQPACSSRIVRGSPGAAGYIPSQATLAELWEAAQGCRGCDLYKNATQAVLGEGPQRARIVMVGEQPGDKEDIEGRPFVGPAGRLLDRALSDAGFARADVYITNAVKHFKFDQRGKRRIHKKPGLTEVQACRPWLAAEFAALKPEIVVCLGATAALSLMGKDFRLTAHRGEFFEHEWARLATATVHPSSLLRIQDEERRRAEYGRFVDDLRRVREKLD